MREIREGIFQGHFHNLLISKNNTFWAPQISRITFQVVIPTQHDRAQQTVVRQALEPEWEAKLSPHTYGFRPGRSCWDAIEAIFHRITFRPQ